MPNYNAHTYFGQQVLQSLPLELRQSCTRDLPLFRLGLYGPDPLIFSYLTKASADRLHQHWREESLPRLERALRQGNDSSASFAAGYLLHQLLDDATHPRIYEYMEADGSSHFRLEVELDRLILQELGRTHLPGLAVQGKARAAAEAEELLLTTTQTQYLRGLWRMASLSQLFAGRLRERIVRQTTEKERCQAEALRARLDEAVEPAVEELTAILSPVLI